MADPAAPEVTMQDLGHLPILATVAFSARCVRRIFPFLEAWSRENDESEVLQLTTSALERGEQLANGQDGDYESLSALAQQIYSVANERLEDAQYVACAAGHVANTAAYASRFRETEGQGARMKVVASAWGGYRVLLSLIFGPIHRDFQTGDMVMNNVRADFDNLMRITLGDGTTWGLPVDSTEQGPLGPLWPDGAPAWYESRLES